MSVSIRAHVDAQDMARVNRILRSVDTSLTDELRSSMKRGILPVAEMIAKRANSYSVPMSGMRNQGRTTWGALRVSASKISVTPGRSRKSPSLVTINFDGRKAVGLAIAENAGTKTGGNGLRGQLFIARINSMVPGWQNGGRYLYRAFMPYQSHVYRLGESILQRWISKTNMELEAR
jgi:hypothetical protein